MRVRIIYTCKICGYKTEEGDNNINSHMIADHVDSKVEEYQEEEKKMKCWQCGSDMSWIDREKIYNCPKCSYDVEEHIIFVR